MSCSTALKMAEQQVLSSGDSSDDELMCEEEVVDEGRVETILVPQRTVAVSILVLL